MFCHTKPAAMRHGAAEGGAFEGIAYATAFTFTAVSTTPVLPPYVGEMFCLLHAWGLAPSPAEQMQAQHKQAHRVRHMQVPVRVCAKCTWLLKSATSTKKSNGR